MYYSLRVTGSRDFWTASGVNFWGIHEMREDVLLKEQCQYLDRNTYSLGSKRDLEVCPRQAAFHNYIDAI